MNDGWETVEAEVETAPADAAEVPAEAATAEWMPHVEPSRIDADEFVQMEPYSERSSSPACDEEHETMSDLPPAAPLHSEEATAEAHAEPASAGEHDKSPLPTRRPFVPRAFRQSFATAVPRSGRRGPSPVGRGATPASIIIRRLRLPKAALICALLLCLTALGVQRFLQLQAATLPTDALAAFIRAETSRKSDASPDAGDGTAGALAAPPGLDGELGVLSLDRYHKYEGGACLQAPTWDELRAAARLQLSRVPQEVVEEVIAAALVNGVSTSRFVSDSVASVDSEAKAHVFNAWYRTDADSLSSCLVLSGVELQLQDVVADWETVTTREQIGLTPCMCGFFTCEDCPVFDTRERRTPVFKRYAMTLQQHERLIERMRSSIVTYGQSILAGYGYTDLGDRSGAKPA